MKVMDLSFLKECAVKESSLAELASVQEIPCSIKLGAIKIAALKRSDFEDRPEIIEKYFKNGNTPLDRFYIPELSAKEYESLIGDPKLLKNKANAKLDTATKYYITKMRLKAVAKDLRCSISQIDTTDYIWDNRYYVRYNFVDNIEVVDNWYRDYGNDTRYSSTAYDAYIREDPRTAVLDTALYDELYDFCITAIRQRKVMLLGKVDKCLNFLRNLLEYTYGFSENPTRKMALTLVKYKRYFEDMLSNPEMAEFLKTNNDITVYGNDEKTRSDYINTYKSIMKSIISGADSDIAFDVELLNEVYDPYIDLILEDVPEITCSAWQLDSIS